MITNNPKKFLKEKTNINIKSNYVLQGVLDVDITEAYNIDLNGGNFTLIYGKRCGNGFIAIPDWGVCVEAGNPDDTFYNADQLAGCKNSTVSSNSKAIAKAAADLYA